MPECMLMAGFYNIALYFALRLVVYGEPAPVMFMDTDGDNVVDLQGFYTGGPL